MAYFKHDTLNSTKEVQKQAIGLVNQDVLIHSRENRFIR